MLKSLKLVGELTTLQVKNRNHTTKVIVENFQNSCKEIEKATDSEKSLPTGSKFDDELFFSTGHIPHWFSTRLQEPLVYKTKSTLLNPLNDYAQPNRRTCIHMLPFDDIPAIGGFIWVKFCESIEQFIPGSLKFENEFGLLSWVRPSKVLFDFYGQLVRLYTPTRNNILLVSNPQHILTIQRSDGAHSVRSILDSMENYKRSKIKVSLPQYEIDFTKVAESFKNQLDLRADDYQLLCNQLALDFVARIYTLRDHRFEVPKNFNGELCMWSLKCFSNIVFGRDVEYKSIGYEKIVDALVELAKLLRNCESIPQLWRFLPTSTVKLSESAGTIQKLLVRNLINTYLKLGRLSNNLEETVAIKNLAVLDSLILKDKMSTDNIITILMDLLIVGVTTIANIAGMVMYYLAKHPDIQERVFWEVNLVLPNDVNELFSDDMVHLSLLRGCVIETLRLWPPFTHSIRYTSKEIILNGFAIPKHTHVVMAHQVAFHKDEHFIEAKKFEPRRWTGKCTKQFDPLEVMPFCYRQHPIVRELAYRQIIVLIAHTLKNFDIEYNHGELKYDNKILCSPNKSMNFTFKDRR